MYGIKKCSGGCLYCSAASTMRYRDAKNGNEATFKIKWKIQAVQKKTMNY